MPHIKLPEGEPGITGPMIAYRETEIHLNGLAQAAMRGASSLTEAERELIAAYVSARNDCIFWMEAHGAAARQLLGEQSGIVREVFADAATANVSDKLRALLVIADKVRQDGRLVADADVTLAREAGADDKAIHDTVLITAMFSMFNRYVDGLATWTPNDPAIYEAIGQRLATQGYGSRFRESP